MEINPVEKNERWVQIAIAGKLDTQAVRDSEMQFQSHVLGARTHVLVDLAGVSFLSSMGMRMLLSAAKALHRDNLKLILLNPQKMAELGLKAANMDALIPIVHSREEAMAILSWGEKKEAGP